MFFVYVLRSDDSNRAFYIGYSSDVQARLDSHNAGQNASTRGRRWQLVYFEAYLTGQAARTREHRLKHDGRVRRFLMDRIREHLPE